MRKLHVTCLFLAAATLAILPGAGQASIQNVGILQGSGVFFAGALDARDPAGCPNPFGDSEYRMVAWKPGPSDDFTGVRVMLHTLHGCTNKVTLQDVTVPSSAISITGTSNEYQLNFQATIPGLGLFQWTLRGSNLGTNYWNGPPLDALVSPQSIENDDWTLDQTVAGETGEVMGIWGSNANGIVSFDQSGLT
ncbi:MAG: hypothetical protein ACYDCC_15470 [Actinomycetota bacterium]